MKKSILFLSLIILAQANPLCAMQRKERRSSGTSVLRVAPSLVTLALFLALVKPASGLGDFGGNCDPFSSACIREKMDERAKAKETPPNFGRFGSEAYGRAVGWGYAERNAQDESMRHFRAQQDHYQDLGHQQGYR